MAVRDAACLGMTRDAVALRSAQGLDCNCRDTEPKAKHDGKGMVLVEVRQRDIPFRVFRGLTA